MAPSDTHLYPQVVTTDGHRPGWHKYQNPQAKAVDRVERPGFVPLDETAAIAKLIEQREKGESEVFCKSRALAGSDDVEGINRLWGELEGERQALAAVDPTEFDSRADYKAALGAVTNHLDADKYLAGLLALHGTRDFSKLKAALTPAEG